MDFDRETKNQIVQDSMLIQETIGKIVSPITDVLDNLISYINQMLKSDTVLTEEMLMKIMLQLNTTLYSVVEVSAGVDIKQEIASMKQKSEYALARKTASGTVAEKDNEAWLATQNISVLKLMYKEANSVIKSKIERASDLQLSLKKILTYRIEQGGKKIEH